MDLYNSDILVEICAQDPSVLLKYALLSKHIRHKLLGKIAIQVIMRYLQKTKSTNKYLAWTEVFGNAADYHLFSLVNLEHCIKIFEARIRKAEGCKDLTIPDYRGNRKRYLLYLACRLADDRLISLVCREYKFTTCDVNGCINDRVKQFLYGTDNTLPLDFPSLYHHLSCRRYALYIQYIASFEYGIECLSKESAIRDREEMEETIDSVPILWSNCRESIATLRKRGILESRPISYHVKEIIKTSFSAAFAAVRVSASSVFH
jgi:hypothetical protein